MIMPFNLGQELNLILAVVIGVLFGLFLERGGLGDPHKLTGAFNLKDFTVPKAMFTAILVALVGMYTLSEFGILNMNRVWIIPTYFWPQVVGGSLFGLGFAVSGYCPGTAVAGFASGRMDALITIIGIAVGSFLFAYFYPSLEGFYSVSRMGSVTLPDFFNMNQWVVIGLVIIMAASMFYFMEKAEKKKTPTNYTN